MINFIQPYSFDLNIGKAYNQAIKPLKGWIVITDQDTLKFSGYAQRVKLLLENADENNVYTTLTNRLPKFDKCVHLPLFDEKNIDKHYEFFEETWKKHNTLTETVSNVSGMCMIFHKSLWEKVKIPENTVMFDVIWSKHLLSHGSKILLAKGLYTFHLYRWGQASPETYFEHLKSNNPKKIMILKQFRDSLYGYAIRNPDEVHDFGEIRNESLVINGWAKFI